VTCEVEERLGDEERPKTVDDIVRDPRHGYVAAIGGDIHNYQRYPVRLTNGETIQYIVSGGGGAYLSSTHMIERVGRRCEQELPADVAGFDEPDFRSYPLRGDSLALFTRRIGPVLFNTILSAFVLIAAGVAELWLVFSGNDDLTPQRAAIILSAVGGIAVLIAFAVGWLKPALVIEKVRPGLRGLVFLGLVAVVAASVTTALVAVDDRDVREAIVVTLALPVLAAAGVIVAYNVRGSAPAITPVLLLVAPVVAAYELLMHEYVMPFELDDGWDGLVFLIAPAVVTLLLVAWLDRVRRGIRERRSPGAWRVFKWALGLVWAVGTAAVLEALGEEDDWLWQSIVVLVVAGLLITLAIPLLSAGREARQPAETYGVGSGPTAWIGVAVAALALLALKEIGGFVALDAAAAFAASLGVLGIVVLLLAAGGLQIGPSTLWHMRTGDIDADLAARIVADHLGDGTEPARDSAQQVEPPARRTGEVRMAEAVRRLGKPVSELADSNQAPFYKNFLSVEVLTGRIEIRCYGVTGKTRTPTLEDCISIPLEP
jgi:hypothetical protein